MIAANESIRDSRFNRRSFWSTELGTVLNPKIRKFVLITMITAGNSCDRKNQPIGMASAQLTRNPTAPEFIGLFLGSRWSGAVAPLEILAFYGSIRSVSALLGPLLTALRETRLVMWTHIAAAVFMPLLFYVGSRWGPLGIACGWIVGYPFIVLPLYRKAFRRVGMPLRNYFIAIRPALDASLAMILAVGALKLVIPVVWPLYLRLGIEVVAGATAYLIALLVLHIDRLRGFIDFYRRLRASNNKAAGG